MRKGGVFEVMGWMTARVACAEWKSEPEVPVKVKVALATDADALAESVTCCGVPGLREIADGETVTPAGNPLTFTVIEDENLLEPLAESDTAVEVPV
jgi:hypothetical protein